MQNYYIDGEIADNSSKGTTDETKPSMRATYSRYEQNHFYTPEICLRVFATGRPTFLLVGLH